jgi:hypothetical protein
MYRGRVRQPRIHTLVEQFDDFDNFDSGVDVWGHQAGWAGGHRHDWHMGGPHYALLSGPCCEWEEYCRTDPVMVSSTYWSLLKTQEG